MVDELPASCSQIGHQMDVSRRCSTGDISSVSVPLTRRSFRIGRPPRRNVVLDCPAAASLAGLHGSRCCNERVDGVREPPDNARADEGFDPLVPGGRRVESAGKRRDVDRDISGDLGAKGSRRADSHHHVRRHEIS